MPNHVKEKATAKSSASRDRPQRASFPGLAGTTPPSLRSAIGDILRSRATETKGEHANTVRKTAAQGMRGNGGALPHLEVIQNAFGKHDVSGIEAFSGGPATLANEKIGARAYASGNKVAFKNADPSLHTAAHEAAHIIQQRSGIQLQNGAGQPGDPYEREADQVAELVAQGKSAEPILDRYGAKPSRGTVDSGAAAMVQCAFELDANERALLLTEDLDNITFDHVIGGQNVFLLDLFKVFLKAEFSYENLEFYQAVINYQQHPSQPLAETVYQRFIGPEAERQINLYGPVAERLKNLFSSGSAVPANVFDDAKTEIYTLLQSDPWVRFNNELKKIAGEQRGPQQSSGSTFGKITRAVRGPFDKFFKKPESESPKAKIPTETQAPSLSQISPPQTTVLPPNQPTALQPSPSRPSWTSARLQDTSHRSIHPTRLATARSQQRPPIITASTPVTSGGHRLQSTVPMLPPLPTKLALTPATPANAEASTVSSPKTWQIPESQVKGLTGADPSQLKKNDEVTLGGKRYKFVTKITGGKDPSYLFRVDSSD